MHLNQQSCVIFSIFARTSSSKDNYFFKSGYNSQCSSFSKNKHASPTHTTHTHAPTFSSHMPLNWKLSFGPSSVPHPSAGQSVSENAPIQRELNWLRRRFCPTHLRSHGRGVRQGRYRWPAEATCECSENEKVVAGPLFVFHLVIEQNPVSAPLTLALPSSVYCSALPPRSVPGDTQHESKRRKGRRC